MNETVGRIGRFELEIGKVGNNHQLSVDSGRVQVS